jgi:hypothetical protein
MLAAGTGPGKNLAEVSGSMSNWEDPARRKGERSKRISARRPAMSSLNLNDVRSEALFASALQPSREPTTAQVRAEVASTVRRLGVRGCAARMAQEFGDAPEASAARMRWARQVVADVFATPVAGTPARRRHAVAA